MKEFPKEEYKKEDSKRDFKPFVPNNFQNPVKNLIKGPPFKGNPSFNPVPPQGFPQPQSSQQVNSSMQSPPTFQHSSFPSQQNPNASMTTAPTKHFSTGQHQQFPNPGTIKGTSCLLYTSPSPRDQRGSRMPSSA